ncbi:MAG: TonB-dependent receptor, partial [Actinomycetota bacterium]|nr:TonB-dependent receptor [Actinomycetota bacterium]
QLDQRETVTGIGPFIRDEIEIGSRWRLFAGARADNVRFDVDDELVADGNPDDSGVRTLRAVSPMAGLVARLARAHAVYGNVSTAFETPTATELGNQPDGSAGLNREVDPQRATTYELGAKGILLARVRYDVAAFTTVVRDELIPFDVPNVPGRRYFRNAGRTEREGAELGVSAAVRALDLAASYSWSRFRFAEYTVITNGQRDTTDYGGKRIPGIPRNQLQASVTGHHRRGASNVFATAEAIVTSSVFANDANTVKAPGYELLNLRLGGTAVFGRRWFSPVIGVQNVFDRDYVSSVVVNAASDKFYEPAAGRVVYVGLTVAAGR